MSTFIGSASFVLLIEDDDRVHPMFWRGLDPGRFDGEFNTDVLWPRGGLVGTSTDGFDFIGQSPAWETTDSLNTGQASRYGLSGVTRDAYGSVLGSVTVKLFRSSDDLKVDQVTSDALSGAYNVTTPYYPDTHYAVFYKSGSPDVFGTTPNTLIAS